jgi:hypothetical protein
MKHQLTIQPDDTVEVFQKKFNRIYPYLKVEFFKKPHRKGQGSSKRDMYPSTVMFRELIGSKDKNIFGWDDNMVIEEFEQGLQSKFGLSVQVFRKSGNVWLVTSATDNWTLKQQNEEGESLELHLKSESENRAIRDSD